MGERWWNRTASPSFLPLAQAPRTCCCNIVGWSVREARSWFRSSHTVAVYASAEPPSQHKLGRNAPALYCLAQSRSHNAGKSKARLSCGIGARSRRAYSGCCNISPPQSGLGGQCRRTTHKAVDPALLPTGRSVPVWTHPSSSSVPNSIWCAAPWGPRQTRSIGNNR